MCLTCLLGIHVSMLTCMISLHRFVGGLGHSLDAAGGHRHPFTSHDLVTPLEHLVGSDISGTMAVFPPSPTGGGWQLTEFFGECSPY